MKFKCPQCSTLHYSDGGPIAPTISCGRCGVTFDANPEPQVSRFNPEIEKEARPVLEELKAALSGHDQGVQQCALYLLEQDVLGDAGRVFTVKVSTSPDQFRQAAKCELCGEDVAEGGFIVWMIDRFRDTDYAIHFCNKHRELCEMDIDFLDGTVRTRMGLA